MPEPYCNMEIEGEIISKEEARLPGWKQQMRKQKRNFEENSTVASTINFGRDPPHHNGNPTGAQTANDQSQAPKTTEDQFRVIVRSRDGIDVKKMDKMTLLKVIAMATGV